MSYSDLVASLMYRDQPNDEDAQDIIVQLTKEEDDVMTISFVDKGIRKDLWFTIGVLKYHLEKLDIMKENIQKEGD